MIFRKTLFWLHLAAGLIAGLAIAVMCFTGVTLAFEKQLIARADRDVAFVPPPAAGAPRLSLDDLTRRVRESNPDARPTAIIVSADPRAAVLFQLGRDVTRYANPFTGELHPPPPAATRLRVFLRTMEDWHRWLSLSGDSRPIGKTINGVCNAAFLLLAITGLYLWIPRTWSWRSVRAVALFDARARGKARDFNWHNSIGLWSAPILIVLTLTALPMSFRWANDLVYRLAGETAPAQPNLTPSTASLPTPLAGAHPLTREAQFAAVQKAFPDWQQITLRLANARGPASAPAPSSNATAVPASRAAPRQTELATFIVKRSHPLPRNATTTVTLDPFSGEILRREAFADLNAGRRARTWTRFLHTGEALGWPGQLAAGLATLGGCFLVCTGFALACRRFFGRRSAA